ncbi:MAG TPA: nuclear transport factor 2 family protein [Caulobacteraceae bacterium]
MDRTRQLLARLEIEELNAEFAHLIDSGQSAAVADLFTETGSYGRATGERSVGRAAIRAAYQVRSDLGPRTARHIFTNLRLVHIDETRIEGRLILTLFAADGPPPHLAEPFLVADYDDVYVLGDDGRWRYESRTVTWVFTHASGKVSPLALGVTPKSTGGAAGG